MIKLVRLDYRLLHGQVCFTWVQHVSANRVIIVDDASANDDLKKSALKLAKPQGVRLNVFTLEQIMARMPKVKQLKENIIMIFGNVHDLAPGDLRGQLRRHGQPRGRHAGRPVRLPAALRDRGHARHPGRGREDLQPADAGPHPHRHHEHLGSRDGRARPNLPYHPFGCGPERARRPQPGTALSKTHVRQVFRQF